MTHVSNASRQLAKCEQNMTNVSNASRRCWPAQVVASALCAFVPPAAATGTRRRACARTARGEDLLHVLRAIKSWRESHALSCGCWPAQVAERSTGMFP
jgi:hypothetical protein